jgi:dipeptidyl-peptidase-4
MRRGHEPMKYKLLLFIILTTCVYTCVWNTGEAEANGDGIEGLTVERIYGKPSLVTTLPTQIQWVGDGKGVSYLETRGEGDNKQSVFVVREVPSGKESVVCIPDTAAVPDDLSESDEDKFSLESYRWDKEGERVLFTFGGELFTLDRKDGRIRRRTHSDGEEMNPEFSPDGEKIAFTRDNDLYVLRLDDDEEIRLTETGSDTVLNGILDWVYMEELFTRGNKRSYYWSPDSERLAFLQIQESPVPEYPIVDLIDTHPEPRMQRYPKAGDPIPIVRVGIVGAGGGAITWAAVDTHDDSYIARLNWLADSRRVAIEKLNRAQDKLTLMFADAASGTISVIFDETDKTWVNVNYLKHFYENKRQFIWGAERSGHQHLYLYNMDGTPIRELTVGNWEVTGLDGVNEKKGRVYFTANEANVMERHLYEVSDKGGEPRQITSDGGIHRVEMSPDNKYFIDRFYSEERPTVVSVYDVKGKKKFEIADQLSPELAAMERPLPEFLKFKSAAGIDYYCSITKPTGFNQLTKYPVIVYVYGGPHAQIVSRRWSSSGLWHSMMADKGYIVFSLDNRGSYGRGKKWEDHILKNLGRYELEDQLAGIEYLRSLPYVDADRIGMWGWSYGGYMTLMALFKAPEVFKAGVAVAPVTDWHLYDAIYTERYMKRPQDNEAGYETASPINFVDGFKGNLLLMHGDADDNVHIQNSVQLVKKLIDAGKDFDFMVYPQKTHGIGGPEARVFLFGKMTDFFDRHLLED